MGAILQIGIVFFKLLFKLIKFTGLHIPLIAIIGLCIIQDGILHVPHPQGGTMLDIVDKIIGYGAFIPTPFIFIGNVIRIFKKDFSLIDVLSDLKMKGNKTHEKVDSNLVGLESGVILGKMSKNYITMPEKSDGHLMVIGGQGSGKSSSIAIPTLLNYNSSIFAIDIKGELSESCKNYRSNMKVFDPTNESSPHYNPYAILKYSDKVQGAREIVNSIIPIGQEKDPYWKQSAQNLLTSCILHFENENIDFPGTCQTIMSTPIESLIETLKDSPVSEARMFVNQFIGAEPKQLASIYSTLSNEIILFATDKDIIRALGNNGTDMITPNDLENLKDVFIRISEDKLEQWKSLLNLMVSQFLKSFEKREDKNNRKILFMIDEFARLGKIETIVNGLATLRSKGIQIMLILQSLAQLDAIYGNDIRKIITDNCNYKLVLNANDVDTQEYFSKLVGTVEKKKVSSSINSTDMSFTKNRGTSTSSEEKRIIKPEEFAYLQKPVVFTPKGFFRPNKVKWYEDKVFIERAGYKEL